MLGEQGVGNPRAAGRGRAITTGSPPRVITIGSPPSGSPVRVGGNAPTTKMAGIFGSIEPFHADTGKWSVYEKRLEQFLIVNDVTTEAKKKACLLTTIGASTCDLIWDLFSPKDPTDASVTFAEICTKLRTHFVPAKVEIAERFRFYQRKQKPDESIATYLASLRNLAKDCGFGTFLDSALRDVFVIGLQDHKIQARLLAEQALTLDSAWKTAASMETADVQTKQLRQPEVEDVNKFSDRAKTSCWRCGSTTHGSQTCRFRELECFRCKQKGHRAGMCRQPRKESSQHPSSRTGQTKRGVTFRDSGNVNLTEESDLYPESDLDLNHLPSPSRVNKPLRTTLQINGVTVNMEIDTGAGYTLISEKKWEELGRPNLKESSIRLRTYTGEPVKICREFEAEVRLKDQCKQLPVLVAGGNGPPLVGRNWLRALRLDWEQILHLPTDVAAGLLAPFKEIFSSELGKIRVPPVHLDLKPGAVPRFHRPRPIPYALRDRVKSELQKLVSAGILERELHSDWGGSSSCRKPMVRCASVVTTR